MCKQLQTTFSFKIKSKRGLLATERPVYANFLGSGQFLSLSMLSFFALCPVSLSPFYCFRLEKKSGEWMEKGTVLFMS